MSDQPPSAPWPAPGPAAGAGLPAAGARGFSATDTGSVADTGRPRARRWAPSEPWIERGDLRAAGLVALVLAVLGLPAGAVWSAISPHSRGFVVSAGSLIPDETEAYIAADGRYLFITGVIGLVAGAVGWFWRARRGPVLATGLALGGLAGALVTALVGHWLSSGRGTGAVNSIIGLRITLHARNLIAIEAVAALAVYLLGVLVSSPDDLSRPGPRPIPPNSPAQPNVLAPPSSPAPPNPAATAPWPPWDPAVEPATSVEAGLDVQQVSGHGNGPDAVQ